MTNQSNKDFGKRKPVSVPATRLPAPPAKRSSHVALLLMGTFAVGAAAYTLMPRQNCERPPNTPTPSLLQSNNTECPPRSSSSSGGGSGGSSSRSGYYSGNSGSWSSSSSSSSTHDTSSHSSVQRGGFGSFAHAVGFSGG